MPRRPADLAAFSSTTLYRYGQRDETTRRAHAEQSTAWRRDIADAAFPPEMRAALLEEVAACGSVREAAKQHGLTYQQVYGAASRDPEFAQALDDVLIGLAPPGARHGTGAGYRWDGCRCSACRAVHAAESRPRT